MNPRTCAAPDCDKPNERHPNAAYCSPECKSRAYSARKLQSRHEAIGARTCVKCGDPIDDKKHPRTRFCSGRCQRQWAHEQYTAKRTAARTAARSGRVCLAPGCGQVIAPERKVTAAYCSDECKKTVNDATWLAKASGYNRLYLYGVTEDQWAAQLAAQDYRCVVCRSDEWPGKDNSPHAEHDHGLPVFILRGIACGECNFGLGKFADDPLRLIAAARYLLTAKANPAGRGEPCDNLALLGAALRVLAGDDPGLLAAADGYVEALAS